MDKEKTIITISKDHRLKIEFDNKNNIINIFGNSNGLKYLGEVCLELSKEKSFEHWHLSYEFYTLTEGSIETIIHHTK